MDSLTHLLMGHAMGTLASNVSPTAGAAVYWATLIGNSLPDIDVPLSILLRRGIQLHRTYTHTAAGMLVLAAATALVLQRYFPGAGLGTLFLWTLLGCLAHVTTDCLNLFGARPFWPLNGQVVELGVLHILDPWLLVLLGGPSLGAYLQWNSPSLVAMGFLAMWPYVVYRIATARKLLQELRAAGSVRARVVPWYASWRYVYETDRAVEFGRWTRDGRLALETFVKGDDPRIEASLNDPRVHHFLRSAEYPVAQVEDDAVVWIDAIRRLRADFRPLRIPVNS